MTQARDAPQTKAQRKNVRAIVELEAAARERATWFDRMIHRMADLSVHPVFIGAHIVWFATWMFINRSGRGFDPFPFSMLTLVISLEAILLSAFVLIAQNRMTAEADRRAALDLQVNLLAEQELTSILRVLCRLAERLGVEITEESELADLQHATDVHQIAELLERERPDGATT